MPRIPAWLWLNLLSLDAPLVALVWQDFAARSFGHPLRPAGRLVLGLTVWAVYLADRLLDIRATGSALDTARHRFVRRHTRVFTILLGVVLTLDVFFATVELRRKVFLYGLAVAGCVAAYLLTFPRRRCGWEKQVAAAVLFSTGVLLVSATWLGPGPLILPGILFAGLCLSDLVVIELLESGRGRLVWLMPMVLALLATVRPGPWQYAVALAGVLLSAVALAAPRLTTDAMRVLADAVLLTPLIF